jgi:hypothetical protein
MVHPAIFRFALLAILGLFAWSCNVSDSRKPDTLTFHVGDSLKTSSGKYDSIQLDLYLIRENDTVLNKTLFRGIYNFPSQLKDLPLGTGVSGDFLIRVIGYRKNQKVLEIGVPFSEGTASQIPIVYKSGANRPPSISFSGLDTGHTFRIKEGRTLSFIVKAIDPDSDLVSLLSLTNPPWPRCGSGSYDTATGSLTFSPSFQCILSGESTFHDLDFRASDNASSSITVQKGASITVIDSNSAPKWKTPTINLDGKEGKEIGLDLSTLYLGDDEKDSVQLSPSCGFLDQAGQKWNFQPGYRDSGLKECTIRAQDLHLPPASSNLKIVMNISDSIRLVDVAITSPKNGFITKDSLVDIEWKLGDKIQTHETSETLKTEGANLVKRSIKDSIGNFGADSITVYLDTKSPSKPNVIVNSPSPTNTRKPRWSWVGGGGGLKVYKYVLDNESSISGAQETKDTAFTPPQNLPHGTHMLYVQERDSAGNWSPSGRAPVSIDTISPEAPKIDVAPYSPLNSLRPVITWKSGGGGAKLFKCKIDSPDLSESIEQTDTSFVSSTDLKEGRHNFYVQERDSAGNWSKVSKKELTLALRGPVGKRGFSDFEVSGLSFSISKSGEKVLAYTKKTGFSDTDGSAITVPAVVKFNGATWETIGDPSPFGRLFRDRCLQMNSKNIPYMCLFDSNWRITVVKFENGKWEPVGNEKFTEQGAGEVSIALSPLGIPYVAFNEERLGRKATVMRFNGKIWDAVGTPGFSSTRAEFFDLAFNSAGVPYIAYIENGPVKVQRFNPDNSTWESVGYFGLHSAEGFPISISISQDDSVFLALSPEESGGDGQAFKYNGTTWESVGNAIFKVGEGNLGSLAIAVDNSGTKYATYKGKINQDQVILKSLRNNQWVNVGPPEFQFASPSTSLIQFNQDGVPFIAISDKAFGGKATVIQSSFDPQ